MSWMEINIAGLSDEMELLPEGTYVFSLLNGAKYGNFDKNKVELVAKVAEGEFTGRIVYFSYPDPGKMDWSPAALKRLEKALVSDGAAPIAENQDPVEYFNQPEVVGSRFVAPLVTRVYESQDGEKKTKTDLKLFKIRPVPAGA